MHHVLHVAATREARATTRTIKATRTNWVARSRKDLPFRASHALPRQCRAASRAPICRRVAFVAFIQNHDQIGNRAFGERLTALAPPDAVRAVAAVYLLLPQIPMLFMGEEWGTTRPFPFFCDFEPELAEAVRKGRRPSSRASLSFRTPQPASAFLTRRPRDLSGCQARLDRADTRAAFRLARVVPPLAGRAPSGDRTAPELHPPGRTLRGLGDGAVVVRWSLEGRAAGEFVIEPTSGRAGGGFSQTPGRVLWQEGTIDEDGLFGPYTVRCSLRGSEPFVRGLSMSETASRYAGGEDGNSARIPRRPWQRRPHDRSDDAQSA